MSERLNIWEATLGYTNQDDGVWIGLGREERNLGQNPTLFDAYAAAREMAADPDRETERS